MKRFILIILAVVVTPLMLFATTYTSAFTGSEDPLSESGAWVRAGSAFPQLQKLLGFAEVSTTSQADSFSIYNTAPGNDQCSAPVVSTFAGGSTQWVGAATRVTTEEGTGFDGYVGLVNDGVGVIFRLDNGSFTSLTSGSMATTSPHTFMLCSVGITHTIYKNGVSTGISASDSMYASGKIGIYAAADFVIDVQISDWSGGDSSDFLTSTTSAAPLLSRRRRN